MPVKRTVFVTTSAIPYRQHGEQGVSAVHIVIHEIVDALRKHGYDICIQVLADQQPRELTPSEHQEVAHLRESGFKVLAPMFVGKPPRNGASVVSRVKTILDETVSGSVDAFYPSARFTSDLGDRLAQTGAAALLTLWSPEGVAASSGTATPRIVYQGDLDFAPWKARIAAPGLFPVNSSLPAGIAKSLDRLRCAGFRRAHLALMKDVRVIANVTDSNARFYTDHGHRRAIYVRNTWPDTARSVESPGLPQTGPFKIIGHVGYLNRTGSTFGLDYLLRRLMPVLDVELTGLNYAVHVIGGEQMAASLRPHANHPRLILRGFVKDLDSELRSAHCFLLLNNAGPYCAAFTRHIVAWSMGLCLIAHSNSRNAIPEMAHLQNCVMAESPVEMAKLIRRCLLEPEFNQAIRLNGRQTYEKYFRPESIATALATEIDSVAH